jgi:hypothetical protein
VFVSRRQGDADRAGFWEEYFDVHDVLQESCSAVDDNTVIYVTGMPMLFGYFNDHAADGERPGGVDRIRSW